MIDLRQGDCLELLKDIPDGGVDMVEPVGRLLQRRVLVCRVDAASKAHFEEYRMFVVFP